MAEFAVAWIAALRRAELRRIAVVAVAAGVFLGLVGPFGMGEASIGRRIVYWLGAILLGSGVGVLTSATVAAAIDREGRRPVPVALLTAALMTAPTAVVIFAFTALVFPHQRIFGSVGTLMGPVFIVSLAMTGVNALAERRARPSAPGEDAEFTSPVRFLDRLPPRLRGGELYAVEAEDHYLRLHTSRGSDLILMRLSDAIAELDGMEGAQTHRSWWVARAAVGDVKRGDGRAMLVLPSGIEAPVSRTFLPVLRSAGWF